MLLELSTLLTLTCAVLIVPFWRRSFFFPQVFETGEKTTSERSMSIDILRGIAIIAVILIHVLYLMGKSISSPDQMLPLNIMNNLLRFAVPVFFITSGALLTQSMKKMSPPQMRRGEGWSRLPAWWSFYKRKTFHILLPYTLCVLAIALYDGWGLHLSVQHFIAGTAAVPYWFIPVLVQFYILFPFLLKIKNRPWFLFVCFLISLVSFFVPHVYGKTNIPVAFNFLYLFAFGMRYREEILNPKKDIKKTWLFAALLGLYIVCVFLFPSWYYNTQLIMGPAFVMAVTLFLVEKKENALLRVLAWIGSRSLWIYLTHFLIVLIVAYFSFSVISTSFLRFIISSLIAVPLSILFGGTCERIYTNMFRFRSSK